MVEIKVIKAIQAAQPSITFIVANQNSPVPEHIFCDVSVIGSSFIDTAELTNDEFEETINQTKIHRVSLTYHGLVTSGAGDAVAHMAAYLESFQARLRFKEQGFSIVRIFDVKYTPMLKDVDMYMTYVLDFNIATIQGHSFTVDVIDKVDIHGDLGTIEYNIEVEI
jgi:hypothetical protein